MAEMTQAQVADLKQQRKTRFMIILALCTLCFVAHYLLTSIFLCGIEGANPGCMLEVSPVLLYALTAFLPQLGNSGIVFGLIWYFGWPAIQNMIAKRHDTLEREFVESAKVKQEAEAESKEVHAKLARLDGEIEAMQRNYQEASEQECKRIEENAVTTVERLKQNAQTSFELQVGVATSAFKQDMMQEAIEQARVEISAKLASDPELRNKLIDQSIASLQLA